MCAHGCVGTGVLASVCHEQWKVLGGEESGVHQLVMKYGVKELMEAGLNLGVARCRQDWAMELSLHGVGRSSDGLAEATDWGGYGGEEGVGFLKARKEYVMRAYAGEEVCRGTGDVLVVATDGSGGARVGMGVVVVKVDEVNDLGGAVVDRGHMHIMWSKSERLPSRYGTGVVNNQHAEDFGGVVGLMACMASGAVMLIVDNLQTVEDIVGAGRGDVCTRRDAMRHRCGQAREMIRSCVAYY